MTSCDRLSYELEDVKKLFSSWKFINGAGRIRNSDMFLTVLVLSILSQGKGYKEPYIGSIRISNYKVLAVLRPGRHLLPMTFHSMKTSY